MARPRRAAVAPRCAPWRRLVFAARPAPFHCAAAQPVRCRRREGRPQRIAADRFRCLSGMRGDVPEREMRVISSMTMLEQRIQQQFFDSADLKYAAAELLCKPIADAV